MDDVQSSGPNPTQNESHILEENCRLSQSLLWKLQRRYFDRQGIRAWNEGVVPSYITSNPWIAEAYARVVLGLLHDSFGSAGDCADSSEPVYVVELGCGSGRFGYLFLNALLGLLRDSSLKNLAIRYVYTDFTEYNLDILRSHPKLQPLIGAGVLDFACFDLESDRELRLSHGGEVLGRGSLKNPLVVLANYVFDGVRQDLFRISEGRLQEGLTRIASSHEEPDMEDPQMLERAALTYDYRPCEIDYYPDPAWNRILNSYCSAGEDSTFLFPCAALAGIQTLRQFSGRMLLLSGDKGHTRREMLLSGAVPQAAVHGSFSFMVNYHAIGQYVAGQQGQFFHTSHLDSSLNIVACLFGGPGEDHLETRRAYQDNIENRGPDDFFSLKKVLEQNYKAFTLEQFVSYLRFSSWDHRIFIDCFPSLLEAAQSDQASSAGIAELKTMAEKIWETYFPIHEPVDLAFYLGFLLLAVNHAPEALEFFRYSEEMYGPEAGKALNMAVCYCTLGEWQEALQQVERALTLDADNERALSLRAEIHAASGTPNIGSK